MNPPPRPDDASAARTGPLVLGVLAGVAHLVVAPFYLASGLLAPWWAIALLLVWWLVLAAWLVRLVVRRSWWTPMVPAVAIVTWFVVLTAGEQLLGWTG